MNRRIIALTVLLTAAATPALGEIVQLGWGGQHQTNTLSAVRAAFSAGLKGVEIDLCVTRDGVAIGLHDAELSNETDGQGDVTNHDWADVANLRHNRRGERISRLTDLLTEIKRWDGEVFLDVRQVPAAAVGAAIAESGFDESRIAVTVFDNSVATDYRAAFPALAGIYLKSYDSHSAFDENFLDTVKEFGYTGLAFSSRPELPPASLMERLETRSLKSYTFVGFTEHDVQALNSLGVDYVVMVSAAAGNHYQATGGAGVVRPGVLLLLMTWVAWRCVARRDKGG
ncbi:MAG: hypothetical protein KJO54_07135 [Gammaproteobacteria bacterium]|nr:hypothetical protein [Gammaproteobacteria bacterium]NNF62403.1 hypothetical protein [Gammaproteobacteria bacterium]NNM20907.1 hypothetical protein [Gammaproteobacteria bacterium]